MIISIFYDMGEINALKCVFHKLLDNQLDYTAVVMNTASEKAEILGYSPKKMIPINFSFSNREEELPQNEIISTVNKIASLNPTLIITGTVSKAQWQICESIISKMSLSRNKVFAYYDVLSSPISGITQQRFMKSDYTYLIASKMITQSKALIVGHPGLDEMPEKMKQVNPVKLRQKLGYSSTDTIITFFGGYGSGYEDSFRFFVQSVQKLQHQIIVMIHPKCHKLTDLPEKAIIEEYNLQNVFIFKEEIRIEEALSISDLVLSQCSTVIPIAINSGITAHYINPIDDMELTMVQAGLCENLQNAEDIDRVLKVKQKPLVGSVHQKTNIPKNSTDIIYKIFFSAICSTK